MKMTVNMLNDVQPDQAGEFVVCLKGATNVPESSRDHESVWAYVPEGYEAVVIRKEPGMVGIRETLVENQFADCSTIGVKFVKKPVGEA